jgi:uncharacterized coiled-coil DUF342 family protein
VSETDDLRQFIRDVNTRAQKRDEVMLRRFDALTAQVHAQTAEIREGRAALREMRAEIRANTQGLLRVLDELRGPA